MKTLHEKLKDLHSQQSVSSYEVPRERIFRHHLTPGQKIRYWLLDYIAFVMAGILLVALLSPAVAMPLSLLFILVYMLGFILKSHCQWEVCMPIYHLKSRKNSQITQFLDRRPKEEGILYLGNDRDRFNKALWFSANQLKTHMVAFGMTGSGKTQFLLGLMYQLALLDSGFIFVDGKASISTWFSVYSIAKQLGLEDNLLVINFLTGNKATTHQSNKISNTLNPFAYGSSDNLMEMLSSFMGEEKSENSMWRGRAEALGRCLLRALCELRDQGKLELSVDVIRSYFPLPKLEALAKNEILSTTTRESINYYLNDLPGWKIAKVSDDEKVASEAELTASQQHGFLTMQFTHVLELLSGTYAHIMKTDLAEIDFTDVIVNRRILYIMLPSLEKSPESLKHLGRMIITSIRNALANLLSINKLTGTKELLVDTKAFNTEIPFGLFFDEYGSYCVEGFADVAAQARELNVMACFSGQDYASFKKSSDHEAERVLSNTGIKIFLKTECDTTKNIAINRGSKAYAYLANHIEQAKERTFAGYRDTGQGTVQEIDRICFDDLFSQAPGDCHILYGDKLWRVKGFYGDFQLEEKSQVNQFIKLRKPLIKKGCTPLRAKSWKNTVRQKVHPDQMSLELVQYIKSKQEALHHAKM